MNTARTHFGLGVIPPPAITASATDVAAMPVVIVAGGVALEDSADAVAGGVLDTVELWNGVEWLQLPRMLCPRASCAVVPLPSAAWKGVDAPDAGWPSVGVAGREQPVSVAPAYEFAVIGGNAGSCPPNDADGDGASCGSIVETFDSSRPNGATHIVSIIVAIFLTRVNCVGLEWRAMPDLWQWVNSNALVVLYDRHPWCRVQLDGIAAATVGRYLLVAGGVRQRQQPWRQAALLDVSSSQWFSMDGQPSHIPEMEVVVPRYV